jgi:hypothetical protein
MKNKTSENKTFPDIQNKSVGASLPLRMEDRFKAIFPEAELKIAWVTTPSRYDLDGPKIFVKSVWVGDTCYAFGGKYETKIWRRAWKKIQLEMLQKLEN